MAQTRKDLRGRILRKRDAAGIRQTVFVFLHGSACTAQVYLCKGSNYLYMYDHFIRESFRNKLITDIKYSDVLQFIYAVIESCF